MSKMRTPAMEKIEKKNAKRKKPVKSTPMRESWKRFKRNPTALIGLGVVCILILVAIFAPLIAPYDYKAQDYSAMMQAPSSAHLFGTDQFGRDIFSRVIYGTRYSLIIALFCTIAALFSGGLLGIIAGYFGGTVDTIIMRVMDIFQSMPTMARNNRAAILRVRGSDYIESSEAIGVSQIQMILKHMIPNAAGIMIIYFVGFLAVSIMMMSSMSYIGVGLTAPTPEWGLILNDGKAYLTSAPYMMLFPALMIMITCFAFNLMGDGLRDAFDPKMK